MTAVEILLRRSPAQLYARRRYSRELRVLCYHGVTDRRNFGRHLDYICRNYQPVCLSDVLAALRGDRPLPQHSVLITFDDGLPSHLEAALPELERRDLSAVFFLVMGALSSARPHWWDQVLMRSGALRGFGLHGRLYSEAPLLVTALKKVSNTERLEALARLDELYGPVPDVPHLTPLDARELVARTQNVGDHSWSHPLLDKLTDEELAHEMCQSCSAFRDLFPDQSLVYAFPNGNHDARADEWLARLGYEATFLFDHAIGVNRPFISRLRVSDTASIERFATIVSGAHSTALRTLRRPM